jgi:hypothetical protein
MVGGVIIASIFLVLGGILLVSLIIDPSLSSEIIYQWLIPIFFIMGFIGMGIGIISSL